MKLLRNNIFGLLSLVCFIIYATNVIVGRVSVYQFSQLSFAERAEPGRINRFADPAGFSDQQAALLLGATAIFFTITMLQREAQREKKTSPKAD